MSYLGFAGSGTVGNFSSTTVLQNMYPAQRYAGRFATVENTPGIVDLYFSTGTAWVTATDGSMLGAFASTTALETAYPAVNNGGKHAYLSVAPYAQYVSDGTTWVNSPTLNSTNTALVAGSNLIALSEVTSYVNKTATGTAFTGACEFAGYICTIAAGNITIYDNTSAAGTVIVPTTTLSVGTFPIFGAGTNGKLALTLGCHVVLSGAATVNILVG